MATTTCRERKQMQRVATDKDSRLAVSREETRREGQARDTVVPLEARL